MAMGFRVLNGTNTVRVVAISWQRHLLCTSDGIAQIHRKKEKFTNATASLHCFLKTDGWGKQAKVVDAAIYRMILFSRGGKNLMIVDKCCCKCKKLVVDCKLNCFLFNIYENKWWTTHCTVPKKTRETYRTGKCKLWHPCMHSHTYFIFAAVYTLAANVVLCKSQVTS